jgi:DNA-binding NarL/FixJ family response regulator
MDARVENGLIRIVIADDHGLVRDGLKALLRRREDMEVVGEAATGRAALEAVERCRPDVAILDIMMPQVDGIEAARRITQNGNTRVLGLTAEVTGGVISRAQEAGILGMIAKECTFDELIDAIRTVAQGQMYLCTKTRSVMAENYRYGLNGATPRGDPSLDDEERLLVRLLAEGETVGQIALTGTGSRKSR